MPEEEDIRIRRIVSLLLLFVTCYFVCYIVVGERVGVGTFPCGILSSEECQTHTLICINCLAFNRLSVYLVMGFKRFSILLYT